MPRLYRSVTEYAPIRCRTGSKTDTKREVRRPHTASPGGTAIPRTAFGTREPCSGHHMSPGSRRCPSQAAATPVDLGNSPAPGSADSGDVAALGGNCIVVRQSIPRRPGRHGTARRQRAVSVMTLVALERRTEDADEVQVGIRAEPMPILRPDVVAHPGLKLPGLPGRQV